MNTFKKIVFSNRFIFSIVSILSWPFLIVIIFSGCATSALCAFYDEFMYEWQRSFFWPSPSKINYESKLEKFKRGRL